MATATVTAKGQLTLPKAVRDELNIHAGDRVDFVKMDNGRFALVPKTGSIKALKGIVPKLDRPVTLEQMQEAIISGALGSCTLSK
jgi:AbrB family looped-hinge helix DNA binding protein